MKKIIVIGLDGGSWTLLQPWINEGILPNFRKLMEKGVWGPFMSTFPPGTIPAWPAMLTGRKPEDLNAFCFICRKKNSYKPQFNRVSYKRSIWRKLNQYNKRCYIINIPTTQLRDEKDINGGFIAGPIFNIGDITNNPELQRLIQKIDYQTSPNLRNLKETEILKTLIIHSKKQLYLVKKILNKDWDFLFYVNYFTDQISHLFWKYLDKNHPDYSNNEEIIFLIQKFYLTIDNFLKILFNKDYFIFVVSDHGFGPLLYEINLINWLQSTSFLKLKEKVNPNKKKRKVKEKFFQDRNISERLSLMISKLQKVSGVSKIISILSKFSFFKELRDRSIIKAPIISTINWDETMAYTIYSYGININLKGREPNGIIDKNDYNKTREIIIEKLLKLKDPEGRRVIEKVWKIEEFYNHPSLDFFPDILIKYDDFSKYRNIIEIDLVMKNKQVFKKGNTSGSHKREGIFIAYGNDIREGYSLKNMNIYDLYPLILHIFSIPIPNDIEGKVNISIFKDNSELKKKHIEYEKETAHTEII